MRRDAYKVNVATQPRPAREFANKLFFLLKKFLTRTKIVHINFYNANAAAKRGKKAEENKK